MLRSFLTTNTLSYLRYFAKNALRKHNPTIIGIAGSVGKTSARNAIGAIVKDHFQVASVGNSETGIPLGVLGLKPKNYNMLDWLRLCALAPLHLNYLKGTKYLIAEMGIDEPSPPKNMEYLLTILKPHIAVILNESATHTMQFEKALTKSQLEELSGKKRVDFLIKKIAEEDAKIITRSNCKIGIYNADDVAIVEQIENFQKRNPETTLLSFGKNRENYLSYENYDISLEGTDFSFFLRKEDGPRKIQLRFPFLLPEVYREVLAATIIVGMQLNLPTDEKTSKEDLILLSLVKNFTLPKGRSSIFKGIQDSIIIDSSYNASKAAVFAFLNMVALLKKQTKRPIVFVFGDMRELGEESKIEHEEVAEKLIGIVDYLYCVGPQTRQFVFPIVQKHEERFKEMRWFDTAVRAGAFLKENMPKNAIVLVKGSQNTIFLEETIKAVLQNKEDEQHLCRQDEYWKKIKNLT